MLKNISRTILIPALALAVFAVPAAAQDEGDGGVQNAVDAQVADLENLRDKFLALAEAFPEDMYEWRPMEGVRSVHEVMALMVAECALFPTMPQAQFSTSPSMPTTL